LRFTNLKASVFYTEEENQFRKEVQDFVQDKMPPYVDDIIEGGRTHDFEPLRKAILYTLGEIGDDRSSNEFILTLRSDRDDDVRKTAVEALSKIKGINITKLLIDKINDTSLSMTDDTDIRFLKEVIELIETQLEKHEIKDATKYKKIINNKKDNSLQFLIFI